MTGYPSDLNDAQWAVLRPFLMLPGKRGRRYVEADLRQVVDGLLYVAHTGCQWRYLPSEYGDWTRAWSQFRRWAANDTLARVLLGVHGEARLRLGRVERLPSLVTIDSSLARGASNGGPTFHQRGGPFGATNGAKRVIAVDVTGLAVAGLVLPANVTETQAVVELLDWMRLLGASDRLTKVLVDAGTTDGDAQVIQDTFGVDVLVHSQDPRPGKKRRKQKRPKGSPPAPPRPFHPFARAWRVEVAHAQLGRSRRLSRSFENTTESGTAWLELACIRSALDPWSGRNPRPGAKGHVPPTAVNGQSGVAPAVSASA